MANEILEELHRIREEMARESHFNLKEFFEKIRRNEEKSAAAGWPMADLKPAEPKKQPVPVE